MTNNKQQTAVEWFAKKVMHLDWKFSTQKEKEKIIQQAKEMDKEQKLNMFNCGRQYQVTGEGTFKQVYQEIYEGDE